MAKTDCDCREVDDKRTGRWHLIVPLAAICFQLVPPLALWGVSVSAYAELSPSPQSWERPVSLLVIGLSAAVSIALGTIGVYLLLVRSRPVVAALLIVICCVPALLGGAVYLHSLLIFLAWA